MIQLYNVSKSFGEKKVLDNITWSVEPGHAVGLVGANGSGKSTLLRLISGVLEPDCGTVQIDGSDVFDNEGAKRHIFFLGDEPFFFNQSSMEDMRLFYMLFYPNFDMQLYASLIKTFAINPNDKLNNFSKGMKRQVALVLALSCKPDILLLDEAFDGLDPLMRFKLRQIISEAIAEHNIIAIISSHNLRELEDICDTIVMINDHKMALYHTSDEVHEIYHKFQVVFDVDMDAEALATLQALNISGKSRIFSIIMKGDKEACEAKIRAFNPTLFERTGVSLEEIFVYEVEGSRNA